LHGDELVLQAQSMIERNPPSSPTVDELARRLGTSRRTFVRRFTEATGNPPRTYIQRARIEAAQRAPEQGPGSIASIASRCGYADHAAFRKIFVRFAGLTPVEYRTRYGPRSRPAHVSR